MTSQHCITCACDEKASSLEEEILLCDANIRQIWTRKARLLQTRNAQTPIGHLATETLLHIFRYMIENGNDGGSLFIPMICCRWYALSSGTPSLWTTIRNPSPDIALAFIARSQNLPLKLDLPYIEDSPLYALESLMVQRKRVQELNLSSAELLNNVTVQRALNRPWPILQKLSIDGYLSVGITMEDTPNIPLALCAPLLHSLEISWCNFSLYTRIFHERITHLQVLNPGTRSYHSISSWLDTLRSMPHLEEMNLRSCFSSIDDNRPVSVVKLPHLQTVHVSDTCDLVHCFLRNISPHPQGATLSMYTAADTGDHGPDDLNRYLTKCWEVAVEWASVCAPAGGSASALFMVGHRNFTYFSMKEIGGPVFLTLSHEVMDSMGGWDSDDEDTHKAAILQQTCYVLKEWKIERLTIIVDSEMNRTSFEDVWSAIGAAHFARRLAIAFDLDNSDQEELVPLFSALAHAPAWKNGEMLPSLQTIFIRLNSAPEWDVALALRDALRMRHISNLHFDVASADDVEVEGILVECATNVVWNSPVSLVDF